MVQNFGKDVAFIQEFPQAVAKGKQPEEGLSGGVDGNPQVVDAGKKGEIDIYSYAEDNM